MQYLSAIDGLRFFAFLAVFIHHFPRPAPIPALQSFGWMGVEVFFAISAFLMMRLLLVEHERTGQIDVARFYVRRLLRIYPLLAFYSLTMWVLLPTQHPDSLGRLLGLLTGTDNFLTALKGYNIGVSFAPHLWTLSYELQIYLVIPIAVLLLLRLGTINFVLLLAGVELVVLASRYAFVLSHVEHPVVWVLPFLRPESTLLGLAIGAGVVRMPPMLSTAVIAVAGWYLLDSPSVQAVGTSTITLFLLCGLISASTVALALNSGPMRWLLGCRPIVFLGRISFGLYVYHLVIVYRIGGVAARIGIEGTYTGYAVDFVYLLGITVLIASVSYYLIERPFLLIKNRKFRPLAVQTMTPDLPCSARKLIYQLPNPGPLFLQPLTGGLRQRLARRSAE